MIKEYRTADNARALQRTLRNKRINREQHEKIVVALTSRGGKTLLKIIDNKY